MRIGGVQEYAEEQGKSRDIVYRLIKEGRLKAERISGSYILDLDQKYPIDKRLERKQGGR